MSTRAGETYSMPTVAGVLRAVDTWRMDPAHARELPHKMTAHVAEALSSALGGCWSVQATHSSGFCAAWRARSGAASLFVKTVPLRDAAVLAAEADGLCALTDSGCVRVPAVMCCTVHADAGLALLALEWLDLRAPDDGFGERLGRALARLHLTAPDSAGRFGWRRDNMIGGTPQRNRWSEHTGVTGWIEFFGSERLCAMRDRLAASSMLSLAEAVDALVAVLPRFFEDGYVPRATLIHGDLWQGNWGMLADGTPVIYDPAVSCSDAEAEVAMMTLFGEPPTGFWSAYRNTMPSHRDDARRHVLYQLYHLLNHALLFGGDYVWQARSTALSLARQA